MLTGVVEENESAVLRPPIRELAAVVRRVDLHPEDVKQPLVGDPLGIEPDLNRLDVPGPPRGNLLVGGSGLGASRVARDGVEDALHAVECRLDAPETTAGQRRGGRTCGVHRDDGSRPIGPAAAG